MSERKPRYFQHEFGGVYYATLPDAVADYENDHAMTEVQVVPIDAIVIRRDELPEVSDFGPDGPTAYLAMVAGEEVYAGNTADDTRLWGLRYLALSEHLREHPPVDEGQVDALRDILLSTRKPADGRPVEEQYRDVARRLVERGVRVGDA